MKPTLAVLVYAVVLGPGQVQTLPPALPPGTAPTPGLRVPVPLSGAATLADPQAVPQPAEQVPPLSLPLKVPVPEKSPAGLTPPEDVQQPTLPPPADLPPPPPNSLPPLPQKVEAGPPRPVPVVPCPPPPFPGPPTGAACRQEAPQAPPWERLRPTTKPAGPAAGYFVVQDVHGVWPVPTNGQTAPPPLAPEPAPVVRASGHPLPPAESALPVILTAAARAVPAPPAKKVEIVQGKQEPKEVAWGARDEYRKIVGQLVRVHVHGGRWVVRYAGLDKEDRYGGSVVLDPESADLGRLREGDVVCVQGEILNGGRAERPLGAPLYRVRSLTRLGGAKE